MNFPDSEAVCVLQLGMKLDKIRTLRTEFQGKVQTKPRRITANLVSMPASFPTRKRRTVGKAGVYSVALTWCLRKTSPSEVRHQLSAVAGESLCAEENNFCSHASDLFIPASGEDGLTLIPGCSGSSPRQEPILRSRHCEAPA